MTNAPDACTPSPRASLGARSLSVAIFILVVNLVFNFAGNIVLGTDPSPTIAWTYLIVHLAVVLLLAVFAIVFGVKALRQHSATGTGGRGAAIAGIVIASLLLVGTYGVTFVQLAQTYAS